MVKLKAKVAKEGAVCQEEVEEKLIELQNLPILQVRKQGRSSIFEEKLMELKILTFLFSR